MPLRVAEKDGYLHAVNGCGHCPFNGWDGHTITFCSHAHAKEDEGLLYRDRIPVWCPLPIYQMVRQENKMRGKHPQNIVWDEPPGGENA